MERLLQEGQRSESYGTLAAWASQICANNHFGMEPKILPEYYGSKISRAISFQSSEIRVSVSDVLCVISGFPTAGMEVEGWGRNPQASRKFPKVLRCRPGFQL